MVRRKESREAPWFVNRPIFPQLEPLPENSEKVNRVVLARPCTIPPKSQAVLSSTTTLTGTLVNEPTRYFLRKYGSRPRTVCSPFNPIKSFSYVLPTSQRCRPSSRTTWSSGLSSEDRLNYYICAWKPWRCWGNQCWARHWINGFMGRVPWDSNRSARA